MNLTEILDILDAKTLGNLDLNIKYNEFKIDSREVKENDIFAAFNGDNVDGHKYIDKAFENGAIAVLIDNEEYFKEHNSKLIILVDDVLKSLQILASHIRDKYNPKVVAITGSNGKTSTRVLIESVLKQKYNLLATKGNLNNHIGLPLTLLRLKKEHELVVLEMGMNHFGEISLLSNIAKPDIGIIINIGSAHIGILGSKENILKAKMEITDGIKTNGTLITNSDNEYLETIKTSLNYLRVGEKENSDLVLNNVKSTESGYSYEISYNQNSYNFNINSIGQHEVTNSLFAIILGFLLKIDYNQIKIGIEEYKPEKRRMQLHKLNKITLIDDAYNAITSSMISAVKSLRKFDNYKILILADMLELGSFSKEEHEKVGNFINNEEIDLLITVGNDSKYINDKVNKEKLHFNKNEELINYIKENNIIPSDSLVLVKGSNGMKLNEICKYLQENY